MLLHYYGDLERSLTASVGYGKDSSLASYQSKLLLESKRPNFSLSSAEVSESEEDNNQLFLPVPQLKINFNENETNLCIDLVQQKPKKLANNRLVVILIIF